MRRSASNPSERAGKRRGVDEEREQEPRGGAVDLRGRLRVERGGRGRFRYDGDIFPGNGRGSVGQRKRSRQVFRCPRVPAALHDGTARPGWGARMAGLHWLTRAAAYPHSGAGSCEPHAPPAERMGRKHNRKNRAKEPCFSRRHGQSPSLATVPKPGRFFCDGHHRREWRGVRGSRHMHAQDGSSRRTQKCRREEE